MSTRAASGSSGRATTRISIAEWLPALDGVVEKLERGALVADVGCGHGASTILMAQAFPNSTFVGSDYHDGSIETARAARQEAGRRRPRPLRERRRPPAYGGTGYDLVTMFDCLHDMGDPVGAARHVRSDAQARRHLDDRRADGRRPRRGQLQPGRPRVLRRSRRCCARPRRCRRRSGSRSARRPARRGSATSSRRAASPVSAGRPRRRSTSCSRRVLDRRSPPRTAAAREAPSWSPRAASQRASRRARATRRQGYVERDGVRVFYEVYGDGEPTVLLLPTWSIVHSRVGRCRSLTWRAIAGWSHSTAAATAARIGPSTPEAYTRASSRPTPWRCMDATRHRPRYPGRALAAARSGRIDRSPPTTPSASTASVLHRARPSRSPPGHPERRRCTTSTRRSTTEDGLGEVQPPLLARDYEDSWSSSSPSASTSRTRPSRSRTASAGRSRPTPETLADTERGIGQPTRRRRSREPARGVRCPTLVHPRRPTT